jgi:hypothetical protein
MRATGSRWCHLHCSPCEFEATKSTKKKKKKKNLLVYFHGKRVRRSSSGPGDIFSSRSTPLLRSARAFKKRSCYSNSCQIAFCLSRRRRCGGICRASRICSATSSFNLLTYPAEVGQWGMTSPVSRSRSGMRVV